MGDKKVLVIGSGGREHALGATLKESQQVGEVYYSPGNGGTSQNVNLKGFEEIVNFVEQNSINLVVVGPEAPLAEGIVDYFQERGLEDRIFGPTKAAAQIEASKIFAKEIFVATNTPTADYFTFSPKDNFKIGVSHIEHVLARSGGVVIKDDALAAGKGVTVLTPADAPKDVKGEDKRREWVIESAKKVLYDLVKKKEHNAIIEDRLEIEEFSDIGVTDGTTFIPFLSSQDHKRAHDGDKGPNTGGMGAYSRPSIVTKEDEKQMRSIAQRVIDEMRHRGMPYKGAIYFGCGKTKDGQLYVLEVNCRFGDPETQGTMALFKGDLYKVLKACATQQLAKVEDEVKWQDGTACCVVLASRGYPGDYSQEKGKPITIGALPDGVVLYHAGTKLEDGKLLVGGGRVLGVTACGKDIAAAQKLAYEAAKQISVPGGFHYRLDIANRDINRQNE
jgi:phosphoribosylamine--glycine ligase